MTSTPGPRSRGKSESLRFHGLFTLVALLALVVGVLLGIWARGAQTPWIIGAIDVLESATGAWIDVLRLLVLPVVITQLFLAVRRLRGASELGGIGAASLGAFLLILCMGNAVALGGAYVSFSAYLPQLSVAGVTAPSGTGAESAAAPGMLAWLLGTLSSGPVLLAAMGTSILVGFLADLLPAAATRGLEGLGERASRAVSAIFRLFVLATPVAAFSLALTFSARQGGALAGGLAWYLVVLCALLVVLTALLYPLATLATGIPLRTWAAALVPAQVLAVATRSSLATVPALLDAARELRLPEAVREFVVPFAASAFKPSTTVSGPASMVFLAIAFDVHPSLLQVVGFLVADGLLSIADAGLPKLAPQMKSLPLYVALGIPVEGYVLVRSVAVLSDVFKTLANTTGYLTAAALVTRARSRGPAAGLASEVAGE